jgi:hypothetical protein
MKNTMLKMAASFTIFLGLATICFAQTETNKYDDASDLIWAGNLLPDATGCEAAKVFIGKIVSVESFESENAVGYEFSLKLANGKQQKLQASISLDEGAFLVDFENLLQKNRRISVKARMCGSGGAWTAEEIKRL